MNLLVALCLASTAVSGGDGPSRQVDRDAAREVKITLQKPLTRRLQKAIGRPHKTMFSAGHGIVAWYDRSKGELWKCAPDKAPAVLAKVQDAETLSQRVEKLAGKRVCGEVPIRELLPFVRNISVSQNSILVMSGFRALSGSFFRCVQAVNNKKVAWTWFRREESGSRFQPFAALSDESFVLVDSGAKNALLIGTRSQGVVRRLAFASKASDSKDGKRSTAAVRTKPHKYDPNDEAWKHVPGEMKEAVRTYIEEAEKRRKNSEAGTDAAKKQGAQKVPTVDIKLPMRRISLLRVLPNGSILAADNSKGIKTCAWLSPDGKKIQSVARDNRVRRFFFAGNCGQFAATLDGDEGLGALAYPGCTVRGDWKTSAREDDLQVFSITNRLMLVHNLLDGRVRVFGYEVIDTAAIQPKKGDVAK